MLYCLPFGIVDLTGRGAGAATEDVVWEYLNVVLVVTMVQKLKSSGTASQALLTRLAARSAQQ